MVIQGQQRNFRKDILLNLHWATCGRFNLWDRIHEMADDREKDNPPDLVKISISLHARFRMR